MSRGYDDDGKALTANSKLSTVDNGKTTVGDIASFGSEASVPNSTALMSDKTDKKVTLTSKDGTMQIDVPADSAKQDVITDLEDIRKNASAGAEHAGKTGNPHGANGSDIATSSTDTTTLAEKIAAIIKSIPAEVTSDTVSGWGFLKKAWSDLTDYFVAKVEKYGLSKVADVTVDATSSTSETKVTISRNDGEADVPFSVPNKDTSLTVDGAYADAKAVGEKLSLRATVADLGNGVFRIADEAVDTTTTEVLY